MINQRIIVSMTSYPKRVDTVTTALWTLLHQTVTPDRLLLWLPAAEFEQEGKALPEELVALEKEVSYFEIKWTDESLRPHNKYYWTLQEFPDDIVITVDDDLLHPTTLIQNLLDLHYQFPQAVIASRTHLVTLDSQSNIAPYAQWELEQHRYLRQPRYDVLATNGAGTLFPPRILPEGLFDPASIRETTLFADDLWLMAWEYLYDIPIVATGQSSLTYVEGTQEDGLFHRNLAQNENDSTLAKLYEKYPQFQKKLKDRAAARLREEQLSEASSEQANDSYLRRLIRRIREA